MLRQYSTYIIPLLFLILSCTKKNTLIVSHINFSDEIELQQNLVFTFNQDLVPDSVLNRWENKGFLKITPEVKGKYRWSSKNELTFSPDLRFAPSTDYKIEFTDELLNVSAAKLKFEGEKSYQFHTPYLALINTAIFWAKDDQNKSITEARLALQFNYKVSSSDVKKLLRIKVGGAEKTYHLNSVSVSDNIQIAIPEVNEKFDNKAVHVQISKGLKCAESNYVSPQAIEYETNIPSKDNFQIVNVETQFEGDGAYIRVNCNQEVKEQNILQFIKIDPKVDVTTELGESGFIIKGNFTEGKSYTVTISKELRGIFEGQLKEDFTQTIAFGIQQPAISFINKKGIYLTSRGEKNIGVRIVNVPKIQVRLYKIYANNIHNFLKSQGSFDYYSEGGDYYDDEYYGSSNFLEYGDLIYDKEILSKNLKKANGVSLLDLNFNDNNDFKGIYVATVNSTESNYIKSTKIVSISDIGLIAKATDKGIIVFANSIMTTQALESVDVTLISSNNQSILKATTDKDGVAKFEDIQKNAPGFRVHMLTAQAGHDFNYLHFDQTMTEMSRYDVGGLRSNPSGYQAYIYGDRNIYRPGETIYINTIVRNDQWEPLANAPVKLKIILPNGKEFINKKGILNKEGAFDLAVQVPSTAVTGSYNLEFYNGNDVLLNSRYISIEEFMPDRIKVTSSLNKDEYKLQEVVSAELTALNLFGPPASNRNYEMEFTLKRKEFYVEAFPTFDFSLNGNIKAVIENTLREGTTDAEGKAIEKYEFPNDLSNSGILQGNVYVTVFDESGRPVHNIKKFDVVTQDVFYGIQVSDSYVATNAPMTIPIIAVSKDGKTLPTQPAKVEVIKYNWQTVLEKTYDSYRYVSQRKEQLIEERTIQVSGQNTSYIFRPSLSGEYEIRVRKPGAGSYVKQYFYAYGFGNTTNSSFEVNKEGNIFIELNKKKYQPGDKAEILFKTPFSGKLLVTLERDKVFEYYFLNTDKKSATLTLPVKEEYLPNVYITATLVKSIADNALPLTVAHGFAPLLVEKASSKIPVEISAPQSSRSKIKQKICVKAGNSSDVEVTLAVVDEGILQLKNMDSPDPHQFFFQKKALEVNSYDLYPKLLSEFKSSSSVGGDGYNLEKRVNPLANKRVKLVAFWSGLLHTDNEGKACYTADIPQFSGDLRIMAVAYKGSSFGSAQLNMKVADPIVLSTSLPRFLSPADTMLVPVTVTNTTKIATKSTVKISSTGPLTVIGNTTEDIVLDPNTEKQVQFKVLASAAIGTGDVVTEITAFNERFTENNSITVRPASSLQKISGSGTINANQTQSINLTNSFIPASVAGRLIISKSPLVQFTRNLDYLVGYPYGCVEQTISRAFPQIYLNDIINNLSLKNRTGDNPQYNVQEAINRLQTMQMYNGALSYWQGGYQESWWGTVYGAHFLLEAAKAGFDVNSTMQEKLYAYLQEKLKSRINGVYYYYNNDRQYLHKEIAAKEIFYSLYVLASAGRQDVSSMNYYKSNSNLLALDSKYMLAATYKLLGDESSYRSLLPGKFDNEKSVNATGGSFYSYTRDLAISLNTLIDTDPSNPQVGILSRHLSQQLQGNQYFNTQENAFSLIALGKLARKSNQSNITAEVKSEGKKIGEYKSGNLVISKNLSGKSVEITTKGNGILYYFWDLEGLSSSGMVKEEDNFLQVRKVFYNRDGQQISGNTFRQNELVVVKISLRTTDESKVENVVITDMLPAGFEIENPRLSESAEMSWVKDQSNPEHFDVRDDRINLFTTATKQTQNFYYLIRVVSKGTFKMGPVSADAMYNGEYHSYNGSGIISVVDKGKTLQK